MKRMSKLEIKVEMAVGSWREMVIDRSNHTWKHGRTAIVQSG